MDYQATLNQLATRFELVRAPVPGAELEPTFSIRAPEELLVAGELTLPEPTQTVAPVPGLPVDFDLAFVAKNVRFLETDPNPDPAAENPIGGLPVMDPLVVGTVLNTQLPPSSLMTSDPNMATTAGVPGVLARLKGTMTPTVEKLTEVIQRHPITIAARWQVYDENTPGTRPLASGIRYRVAGTAEYAPLPVEPLERPGARAAEDLQFAFPLVFSELRSATPDVRQYSVQVSIQLTLTLGEDGSVETAWIDLPAIPLALPTVPIPTLLVLFEHRDFNGRAFVCVPSGSLVGAPTNVAGSITLKSAFDLMAAALRTLAPEHPFLGFVGSAAGAAVAGLVGSPGQVIVTAQSRIVNLELFVFDPGGWFGVGRLTGEDMASSIVCVGPENGTFDFFHSRDLIEDITRLRVKLDAGLGIAIRALHQPDPTAAGDVVYGGVIASRTDKQKEDRISSLQILPP